MITVRPYNEKDYRFVQNICMSSVSEDKQTPLDRVLTSAMYCDYYLDCEPQFCFVATDAQDEPVGCILCAADGNFRERFTEEYLPLIRKLSGSDYFRLSAENKVQARYVKQGFTAHFRVEILPEYCGGVVYSQLVGSLLAKLKEMFVEGVFTVCRAKDDETKSLLEQFGFDDIDYLSGAVVFGKKIFSEDGE